jgi:ubiquinone/menaquinone biosynthesis C-methylase UbiE
VSTSLAPDETRRAQVEKLKSQWSVAAPGWDKGYDWYVSNFRPLMDWCCDITGIAPGDRVLDIGTGTGQPALSAAERVAPTGSVLAIDISPEMLRAAERRARELRLDNVQFREMDAQHLTLEDESFDAVTFTCGLMFCHDPVRAVAEIHRVLRPGGRFAVAVWDEAEKNPFISLLGKCVAQVIGGPPPDPRAPGAFRLAQPDELADIFRSGSFSDFEIESRPMTLEYPSIEGYLEITADFAGGLKMKLESLSETDRNRLKGLLEEAMTPFVDGGVLRLTATPLCAWGQA